MKKKKICNTRMGKKVYKPGTNVHPINGHYYLYECKSVYDPVKKKEQKK